MNAAFETRLIVIGRQTARFSTSIGTSTGCAARLAQSIGVPLASMRLPGDPDGHLIVIRSPKAARVFGSTRVRWSVVGPLELAVKPPTHQTPPIRFDVTRTLSSSK